MARIAVEQLSTGSTVAYASYDSTRWTLGSLIKQYAGTTATDKYIGPSSVSMCRPFDESTGFATGFVDAISWSSTVDWVFGLENINTGTTRRIVAYKYDRTLDQFNWKGFITFTLNTAATHTNRGFVMTYYTYSAGTVSASGTAVTGSSTAWQTNRVAAGARIGFGTTDPTAVTTWYVISAIGSDTAITLSNSAGTIAGSTSYVIEELRPVIVTTNSTATNGGVFVAKGVNWDDFTVAGTTISASAAGTDNLKLVYWLADAGTVTNTASVGAVCDGQKQTAGTSHTLYVNNSAAGPVVSIYKYNLRAADTVTSGKMTLTGSNIVVTGTQSVADTPGGASNLEIATALHGPGSGTKSLYFATLTRMYRADVANITGSNSTWQSDSRTETVPGNSSTLTAGNLCTTVSYDSVADRFFVGSSSFNVRSYWTNYPTNNGDTFESTLMFDCKQLESLTADARSIKTVVYNGQTLTPYVKFSNGIGYISRLSTADGNSTIYSFPAGVHWDSAAVSNQVAITPAISTPNACRYLRVLVSTSDAVGSGPFTTSRNVLRVKYRTSGISDNSGSWTLVDSTGNLSAAAGASSIQFRIEFQMFGHVFGVPAKLYNLTVVYEDLTTDSHYQPSATHSSVSAKKFAWRFATPFGTTVPALRVRLYNTSDPSSETQLVDDNTDTPTGTFEKSTDGGSNWVAWTNADKGNDNTYIRYTPASPPADNIKVRALLTLN